MVVTQELKLLHSRDQSVRALARDFARAATTVRLRKVASWTEVASILDGSLEGALGNRSNDIATLWSRRRINVSALKKSFQVQWNVNEENDLILSPDGSQLLPNLAEKALKGSYRNAQLTSLKAKVVQDRFFIVNGNDQISNHFLNSGSGLGFRDWRFIFRAKLGLLPLNNRPWCEVNNCRNCAEPYESVGHVMSVCPPMMGLRTARHNRVVDRLVKALPVNGPKPSLNKRVPLIDSPMKPDIVLFDRSSNSVVITDIVVCFESDSDSLELAREEKNQKIFHSSSNVTRKRSQNYNRSFRLGFTGIRP